MTPSMAESWRMRLNVRSSFDTVRQIKSTVRGAVHSYLILGPAKYNIFEQRGGWLFVGIAARGLGAPRNGEREPKGREKAGAEEARRERD